MQAATGSETPLLYLLGEKYIKTMGQVAGSANAKTVILPADLLESVKGLMGRVK